MFRIQYSLLRGGERVQWRHQKIKACLSVTIDVCGQTLSVLLHPWCSGLFSIFIIACATKHLGIFFHLLLLYLLIGKPKSYIATVLQWTFLLLYNSLKWGLERDAFPHWGLLCKCPSDAQRCQQEEYMLPIQGIRKTPFHATGTHSIWY